MSLLHAHIRRTHSRRPQRALTLIELCVTIAVLTVALCATASTVVTSSALNDQNRESEIARRAAENMLEVLRNADFRTLYARYDSSTLDDPAAPTTSPGARFAVTGLTPLAGAPGGMPGSIVFPGNGPELRENVVAPALGLPRDLNADGAVDGNDHAADYRVLPVIVRVQWRSRSGPRTVELATLLSEL